MAEAVSSAYYTHDVLLSVAIALALLVGLVLVANAYTVGNCVQALLSSHRGNLQKAVAAHDVVKSEGYLQVALAFIPTSCK